MARAELKTKKTSEGVDAFIASIGDKQRRADCATVSSLMKKATKQEPKMWGTGIVGFGDYRYRYATGREGDWFVIGFSPRKANLTLYIMDGFPKYADLMSKLGTFTTGKSCLYIKRLADIDMQVLEQLITASVKHMSSK